MKKIALFAAGSLLVFQALPLAVLADDASTSESGAGGIKQEIKDKRNAFRNQIQQERKNLTQSMTQGRAVLKDEFQQKRTALNDEMKQKRDAIEAEFKMKREALGQELKKEREDFLLFLETILRTHHTKSSESEDPNSADAI